MNPIKNIGVLIVGFLSAIYIINPTAGILEFIPDNLPIVGNLDEAAAVTILIACLNYFGIDITSFFNRYRRQQKKSTKDVVEVK